MVEKNGKNGFQEPFEEINAEGSGYNNNSIKYCTNCGTAVNDTTSFCGKCGYDLKGVQNPTTYNHNRSYHRPSPPPQKLEWKPIVIGGLIAFGLSFLIGFVAGFLLWDVSIWTIIGIGIIVNFICLFIGGLYAGITAKTQGGTNGMYAGLVSTLISIFLNAIIGFPSSFVGVMIAVMIGMCIGGLGGFVGSKLRKVNKVQYSAASQSYYG